MMHDTRNTIIAGTCVCYGFTLRSRQHPRHDRAIDFKSQSNILHWSNRRVDIT